MLFKKSEEKRGSERNQEIYKRKSEARSRNRTSLVSFSVMPKCSGRGDLEQKSLADERESYKGTMSAETTIENEMR